MSIFQSTYHLHPSVAYIIFLPAYLRGFLLINHSLNY